MALYLGETQIFGVATGDAATQENLDAEITTQDNLIAQIATALEGKTGASGGSSKNTINVTINAASAPVYYFDADGTACEVSMGNNVSVDVLYGVVTYYAHMTIQAVLSGTYVEHTNATSARAGTVCFLEDGGSIELIDAPA